MTEPAPPKRLVPPRMTAAIAESSSPDPHWYRPDCRRPAYSIPAMLATVAEISNTWNLMRLVLTPVNSAAVRFPPVARTWRPNRVRASTTAPMATAMPLQKSSPGTGPMLPDPKIVL